MKLSSTFLTHESQGEHYMISTNNSQFKGIVKNNETAAFIIECLKSETTEDAIVDKLLAEYSNVDRDTVAQDVAGIINKLRGIHAIEE